MDRSLALVSVEWLSQRLGEPALRVVDVRWFLPSTGRSGFAEFKEGHIPRATFADLDRDLSDPHARSGGRHPLPSPEVFAKNLQALGIGPTTHVVAYDDSVGSIAARLWWMLRQIGHERSSILDGGIGAWRAAGLQLEVGDGVQPTPSTYPAAQYGAFGAVASWEDVIPAIERGALLFDARAPERFDGSSEPIDPRAGHIPGARNLPFLGNMVQSPSGVSVFMSPDALRKRFEGAGAKDGVPVMLSCGSGVTACHNALAMYLAGFDSPTVYIGSWSEWSTRKDLPIEIGAGGSGRG